jgi:two-component system NtrC family response regulator
LGEHARVLIVDDDESIRKTLAEILNAEGYLVDTAESGKEAIQKTKTNFYNLALIDIRLPDMEGTEVLIKMRDTVPKMRKIIITGYPSLQNAVESVNREANAYLLKPFDIKKALETIEEQLRKQRQENEYSQDKVTKFIETRVRELEAEDIPEG